MKLLDLVILILATWRISSLLANESGPANMLERLRLLVGADYDESSQRYAKNWLASEMLCQWCNSIWIGIVLTAVYMYWPNVALYVCLPFALSTGTILVTTSKGLQVFLRRLGEH